MKGDAGVKYSDYVIGRNGWLNADSTAKAAFDGDPSTKAVTRENKEQIIFEYPLQIISEIVIKTEAGYELVAFFDQSFSNNSNFDNYSDEERIIKNTVNLTVPGYILNPSHPGIPNLARSYFSAPVIEFGYVESSAKLVENNQPDPKPEKVKKNVLTDLASVEEEEKRGELEATVEEKIINPFTGKEEVNFSQIRSRNQRAGETVASSLVMTDIELQNE